jgi:hypothetical protein
MKVPLIVLFLITACGVCLSAIGPIPGDTRVRPAFEKADLVCKCTVSSTSVSNAQFRDGTGTLRTGERVRANLTVEDVYKSNGQVGQPVVLDYVRGGASTDISVQNGQTLLLFLTRNDGNYSFADPFIGATSFSSLPQQGGQPGLAKLERALVAVSLQQNHDESIRALALLQGFDALSPQSLAAVHTLTTSPDRNIEARALAVLLQTKTPQSVADVRRFLDMYLDEAESPALLSIGGELNQISDNRSRADVEVLSASRFLSVRIGAMNALRHMKDRRSAPVLIQRLDDSNSFVRYLAVMTLAETFDKYDDGYAPSAPLFDNNSGFYTNLWKTWWSQQAR